MAQYVMSAFVYDVGYDARMIKTRENMVTVRFFGVLKKNNVPRHRSPIKYQDFEAHCYI